jgi:hypothetical protein
MQLHGGIGATDLAYSIRMGDTMLSSHAVPQSDLLSFSAAANPWTDQQWGAQLLFASVFGVAGWIGLALLFAVLSGLLTWFVFATCRARGAVAENAAILAFVALVLAYAGLSLRAQLIGAILFAATLYVLSARGGSKRLIALVPIAIIWVNTHGSFALEPVLIGFALLDSLLARRSDARALAAVLIACLVATLVNPFGLGAWTYLGNLETNHVLHAIAVEWQAPSVTNADGITFFISVIVAAGLALLSRRVLRPVEIVMLIVFAALAVSASRNQLWWALVAVTTLSRGFTKSTTKITDAPLLPVALCGIAAVAFALATPWALLTSPKLAPVGLAGAPEGAAASMQQYLSTGQRVFSFQPWSSWFELSLPNNPVLVDSIIEANTADVWSQYFAVSSADAGWDTTLHNWNISALALSRTDQSNLIRQAELSPDWKLIHKDSDSEIFVRR